MIADRNEDAGKKLVFRLLLLARHKGISVRTVNTSHTISPVIIKCSIFTVGQVQTRQPHIPESYTSFQLIKLTSLDPRSPLSPIGIHKASLHERKRGQYEKGNQIGLRKILHHLRLPLLDVSISPEHHRQERDRLCNREQEVRSHHTAQHIVRTRSRE